LDTKETDSLLEALAGLVALCHRFLAFAQAPGGLGLDQRAASDLPLFVEALTLAAQSVLFFFLSARCIFLFLFSFFFLLFDFLK
jgi:hypothetical protein